MWFLGVAYWGWITELDSLGHRLWPLKPGNCDFAHIWASISQAVSRPSCMSDPSPKLQPPASQLQTCGSLPPNSHVFWKHLGAVSGNSTNFRNTSNSPLFFFQSPPFSPFLRPEMCMVCVYACVCVVCVWVCAMYECVVCVWVCSMYECVFGVCMYGVCEYVVCMVCVSMWYVWCIWCMPL